MRKFRFVGCAIVLILGLILAGCDNLIIQNLLDDISRKDNNKYEFEQFIKLVKGKPIVADSSFASKIVKTSEDKWIVTKEGVWVPDVPAKWVVTKDKEWVDESGKEWVVTKERELIPEVPREWVVTKERELVPEVPREWVVTKERELVPEVPAEWVVTKESEWVDDYQPPYVVVKEAEWVPDGKLEEAPANMKNGVSYNNITTNSIDLLLENNEKIGTVALLKTGSGNVRTVDVTVTLDSTIENISLAEVRIYSSTTAPTIGSPGTLSKTNTNGEVTGITLVNNGDFVYVLATVEVESGYWIPEVREWPPIVPGHMSKEEGYWTEAEEEYWTEEEGYWTEAKEEYWTEEEGYWEDIPGYWIEEEGYWTEFIPGYFADEEGYWVYGASTIIDTTKKISFGYSTDTNQIEENTGMIFMNITIVDNENGKLTVTFDYETGLKEVIKELRCAISDSKIGSDDTFEKVENFTHVFDYKSGEAVYLEAIMQF